MWTTPRRRQRSHSTQTQTKPVVAQLSCLASQLVGGADRAGAYLCTRAGAPGQPAGCLQSGRRASPGCSSPASLAHSLLPFGCCTTLLLCVNTLGDLDLRHSRAAARSAAPPPLSARVHQAQRAQRRHNTSQSHKASTPLCLSHFSLCLPGFSAGGLEPQALHVSRISHQTGSREKPRGGCISSPAESDAGV